MGDEGANKQDVGSRGEDLAAAYLERKGCRIMCRNYRTNRGEVDIIGLEQDDESGDATLVFIEVKTRSDLQYGVPLEAITEEKMERVRRAAEVYILQNRIEDTLCRFDVVGILITPQGNQIEHIQDVIDY